MSWKRDRLDISIVIPVYQATNFLLESLYTLDAYIEKNSLQYELILVNDGSTDGSEQILLNFAASHDSVIVIDHKKNLGKGRSVADGIAAARAPIVVFTDIDIPYDLNIFEAMYEIFKQDAHISVVVGSRRHEDSIFKKTPSLMRRAASTVYSQFVKLLIGLPAHDIQCGVKAFRIDAARLLFSNLTVSRFAFDAELFFRIKKFDLKFVELPVVFSHIGHSTVRLFPSTIRMVVDVWRLYVSNRAKRS
jgi:glycosyltransferase involved in cell wall biosynthesis